MPKSRKERAAEGEGSALSLDAVEAGLARRYGRAAPRPLPTEPAGRIRPSFMTETNLGAVLEPSATVDRARALAGPLRRAETCRADAQPKLELAFHEDAVWSQQRDATAAPWRSVCHLELRYERGSGTGTGWLADATTVVTAGHNLLHPDFGWATAVGVRPGLNLGAIGLDVGAYAITQRVHPKWKATGGASLAHDIGCLKLADGALGSFLGHFGLRVFSDEELRHGDLLIHCAGYPSRRRTGSMWVDAGRVGGFDDRFIYHRLDTEAGNSGGPVFARFPDGQRLVLGSHAHGTADRTANAAVRITDEMFDLIHEWIG